MKAVLTVIGKDDKGIIAKVSSKCFECGGNISDISQSVMKDYFAMIMLVDITGLTLPFTEFMETMETLGHQNGLEIVTMHEDIFNSMHKI